MIQVSHNNPIAPSTAPSADEIINALQAHHSMLKGEAQTATTGEGYNPYQPVEQTQQDAQQAHAANMQQYLAPVPMNQYDVNSEHTEEKAKLFSKNIEHDPAFNEIGDEMHEMLEPLRLGIANGQIDINQAKQIAAQWGAERFDPVFEKHHGKHSASHKISLHDTSWIKEDK
ncbi:hypothetical protein OH773_06710 [Buttiauxella sp. WJP83]|uniref:hypothetical protein n=1 Tax=Buttiauxella sp. WJP83 TaxID=2986951 RepID=UPI0022DD646E|nr:hypothetical protein [Buttiauxella sp. WJP83]WBM71926.1 hypothetical protein OH773_06710 [Buttiauxella sp. WJP83]